MLPLRQRLDALHRACSVRYERQGTRGRNRRIELAHAAGGRIPGIRIQLAPGSRRGLIQFLEIPVADVNLSAHFHTIRRNSTPGILRRNRQHRNGQGYRRDRAYIAGDVLPLRTIPASGPQHQFASFVGERNGKTVHFRLHGHLWTHILSEAAPQPAQAPFVPRLQLGCIECLPQR